MNYDVTKDIIDALKPYINTSDFIISTENEDWRGRTYKSDFITIDSKNNVHFEVFDNQIIVSFFSDHIHFQKDSESGNDFSFINDAKEFLIKLFTLKIRREVTFKGSKIVSERYLFVNPNGTTDCPSGIICHRLLRRLNPFLKKTTRTTIWIYDKEKAVFSSHEPKKVDPEAVETIYVNKDCYIEIFENNNIFTYTIMVLDCDDYEGNCYYFWVPKNTNSVGFYDTKEKAIEYAYQDISEYTDKYL